MQRISVARAILKGAPILVLDEATAFVDHGNEHKVQMDLRELVKEKTVIAHRLKTIRRADNIIVLDGGRVVEQDSHDELLAKNGLYARLWMLQQEAQGWSIVG